MRLGLMGSVWGIFGVLGILGWAVARLAPVGLEPLLAGLAPLPLAGYGFSLVFFLYTEGYRAFQKGFSPRVAARAHHLRRHPRPWRLLLAPLFCMGFFGATRRRLVVTWSLTAGLVLLIVAVRQLPQPWRGAVDLGVVSALIYGMVVLVWSYAVGFVRDLPVGPDVDDPGEGEAVDAAHAPRQRVRVQV
jgi:hypothetical protein